jgi:hypothetical protein
MAGHRLTPPDVAEICGGVAEGFAAAGEWV